MKFTKQIKKIEPKKTKIKIILLFLIVLLASFLRLWDLSNSPAGLNADEAAIGYNAYSLIQTGRDEHGQSWPVHFKSFGDYKPGFYFYLVLPLVKFLGLNIWSVRLPSALLGILAVWLVYLLVKELFKSENLGLLSAFFLAISPWHLHYSRGGWESNAANTFILLGILLFIKALKRPKLFTFSVLSFVVSLYTYHSARLVAPLLFIGLVIIYAKKIFVKKNLKPIIIAVAIGLMILLPLAKDFLGPAGISRFSGVGLLSDSGPFWRINELRGEHANPWGLMTRVLHNKLAAYGVAFGGNWLSHFNGNFLFLFGDVIERNRIPETGQMYLFDILFLVTGIYFFLKRKQEGWLVIFLWLIVAPVAAAMTFQTPHALRSNNMVFPLIIISAYGLWTLGKLLMNKRKIFSMIFYLFISLFIIWNSTRYFHQYYVHYPQVYPAAWEYGFDQLVDEVKDIEGQYEKIYVTDRYDQPYILFLFYLKYSPEKFQKEVQLTPRDQFGFSTVRNFGKFQFGAINWDELKTKTNILVIGTPEEINTSATILKRIYFKNGQTAFLIVKV